MIWLAEEQKLIGCVPMLKKEYSEEEIRKMSQYHCCQGWSVLSKLVMKIQGTGFKYDGEGFSSCQYRVEAKRLVDVCFNFDFECFWFTSDSRIKKYQHQIFDVFKNLTLYKVEEHSEDEVKENILREKQMLEQWVSSRTLSAIDLDVSTTINEAKEKFTRLTNLQKMFADNGYKLTNDLFADADEAIMKQIYEERKVEETVNMPTC